ncbi:MAG TPA: outer membrane protein assembly factor BamD [Blastocatellia bacterium]|nr:outer membrane protein assembly factor BamD [Blastocatellia bacterium]
MKLTRLTSIAVLLLMVVALIAAGCGKAKDKVANENEARPGRDKELFEDAMKKLEKGRYDESRLLFNVVVTTYPDSEYLPKAKLAIADSFYIEGGSTNLEQAIGGYKDFAQYFPTHPLTCDVLSKVSEAYMRQIVAYNRDWTNARKAENQLKATLQKCGNSPLQPQMKENLRKVQQVLGLHELDIARFYQDKRQAYKAAEGRLRDIIEKYPDFTYRDESLFRLGVALIEQEQPEEAAQYFITLLRDIPNSEHAEKAKEYLTQLNKPIPTPVNDNPAPPRPGKVGQFMLILGRNDIEVSQDGVLVKKEREKDKQDEQAQAPAPVTTSAPDGGGAQTVRVLPNQVSPTTAPAAQPATSAPAQPATNNGTAATNGNTQTATPATGDKATETKPEKKKKGVFGRIFR